jgi:phenylalanyl-tRNA synthetase alpha subunit
MVTDKQDLWFSELEKENNERLAQLELAIQEKDRLHAVKVEKINKKAETAAKFNAQHPNLSFLKRYNVIIITLLFLFITVVFNVSMFIG